MKQPLFVLCSLCAMLALPSCLKNAGPEAGATGKARGLNTKLAAANKAKLTAETAATPPQPKPARRDDTLLLLVKLAEQQDELKSRMDKLDQAAQAPAAVPAAEAEPKATAPKAPEPDDQTNTTLLERLTAAKQGAKKSTDAAVTPPAPAPEKPAVQPQPPVAAQLPPVPVKAPAPVSEIKPKVEAPAAPPSKWTPYARALRAQVRESYESVLKEFPESPEAIDADMGIAAMAEEDEDWPAAVVAYEHLIKNFPKAPVATEAQYRLAGALAAQGKFDDARRAYLATADGNPQHALAGPALIAAADCLAWSGKTSEALREYRSVERVFSNTSFAQEAIRKSAELLMKERRFPEAVEAYKRAAQAAEGPHQMDLEYQLAVAQTEAGKITDAQETLTTLLAKAPSVSIVWQARRQLACVFEGEDKPLDAARAFLEAAVKCPKTTEALETRLRAAQAFLMAELAAHATEQSEFILKALPAGPDELRLKLEPDALFTAARAARMAGDTARAKARLSELRQKYPHSPMVADADLEEAETFVAAGQIAEAVALLRQVVRRAPDAPRATSAMVRMAELQERTGNATGGVAIYSELLNKLPESDQVSLLKLRRGVLLQEVGRDEEAAKIFKSLANDINVSKAAAVLARYQQALLAQRSGRLEEAIAAYEQFADDGSAGAALLNMDMTHLVNEAKWKAEKLKWLVSAQSQPNSEKQTAARVE